MSVNHIGPLIGGEDGETNNNNNNENKQSMLVYILFKIILLG